MLWLSVQHRLMLWREAGEVSIIEFIFTTSDFHLYNTDTWEEICYKYALEWVDKRSVIPFPKQCYSQCLCFECHAIKIIKRHLLRKGGPNICIKTNSFQLLTDQLPVSISLQWRHNDRDGVSNHQPYDCLLNRLFKAQIINNFKAPCHWPLCGEFTGDLWNPRTKGQ